MTDVLRRYLAKLDELRALRAEGRDQDEEAGVLDEMDELWEDLDVSERAVVREEGWRAWPHRECPDSGRQAGAQSEDVASRSARRGSQDAGGASTETGAAGGGARWHGSRNQATGEVR